MLLLSALRLVLLRALGPLLLNTGRSRLLLSALRPRLICARRTLLLRALRRPRLLKTLGSLLQNAGLSRSKTLRLLKLFLRTRSGRRRIALPCLHLVGRGFRSLFFFCRQRDLVRIIQV